MMSPAGQNTDWRRDLLSGVLAITQRKRLFVGVFMCVMCLASVKLFTSKPFYRASAAIVLLPREKPILDIAAQSDTLESSDETARRAQASSLTLPPNPELYATLMRSGELAERINTRLVGGTMTRNQIQHSIGVSSTEEGLLTITCEAEDPELSAQIVGMVIEECELTSKTIERQLMMQQTGYLDGTITSLRDKVESISEEINMNARRFGVSNPEQAASRSMARIRRLDEAQIRLQTTLQGLKIHRTSADPMIAAISAELESVIEEREIVTENFCGNISEDAYSSMLAQWTGLNQELNQAQDLLMSLRAKRDLFVIRAEQPSGNIAVIRAPSTPSVPAGPRKRRIVAIGLLAATSLSLLACVIADQIQRAQRAEESNELLIMVRQSISPASLVRRSELA